MKKWNIDYISIAILFLFVFLCFVLKPAHVYMWDDISYLNNFLQALPAYPLLGRIWYSYFHIGLIHGAKYFLGINESAFSLIIQCANILWGSSSIIIFYKLILLLCNRRIVAIFVTIFLMFSNKYIILSTGITTEPMSFFFILLSFYLFLKSSQVRVKWMLYLAAFCFGISFGVRETSLLFYIFFIYELHFGQKDWSRKTIVIFHGIVLLVILIGPLLLVLFDEFYLAKVSYNYSAQHIFSVKNYLTNFPVVIDKIFYLQICYVLLPCGLASLFYLFRRSRYIRGFPLLICVFIIPIFIQIVFVFPYHLDERYVFSANYAWAILFGALLLGIGYIFDAVGDPRLKHFATIVIAGCILVPFVAFQLRQTLINKQRSAKVTSEAYKIYQLAPTNSIFISRSDITPNLYYHQLLNHDQSSVLIWHFDKIDVDYLRAEIKNGKKVLVILCDYKKQAKFVKKLRMHFETISSSISPHVFFLGISSQ